MAWTEVQRNRHSPRHPNTIRFNAVRGQIRMSNDIISKLPDLTFGIAVDTDLRKVAFYPSNGENAYKVSGTGQVATCMQLANLLGDWPVGQYSVTQDGDLLVIDLNHPLSTT